MMKSRTHLMAAAVFSVALLFGGAAFAQQAATVAPANDLGAGLARSSPPPSRSCRRRSPPQAQPAAVPPGYYAPGYAAASPGYYDNGFGQLLMAPVTIATAPFSIIGGTASPLVTGRSVAVNAQPGDACETPVRTCELREASFVGNGCSCKVAGGRARGSVIP